MASTALASPSSLDIERVRRDFPTLHQEIHGHPLAYLDNAATTQTPHEVIDAITALYTDYCSNVHRGVHTLSARATKAHEEARHKVAEFINAPSTKECVFVRGTTEAINLVAHAWGSTNISAGDEILVTELEHHSNFVPWQGLCERTGATFKIAPINDDGSLDLAALEKLLTPRTKLVAIGHVSNALGTVLPVRDIVDMAHKNGSLVLVDGAQAVPHGPVDVQALGADFYAFSGHKMYGPFGIGVLWARYELLEAMPPWEGGGGMIRNVTAEGTTYAAPPERFEAGTPNVAGAVGLGAACDYLRRVGMENVAAHEKRLLDYANEALAAVPGLTIIGNAEGKAAVISFVLDGVHPHDLGTILDQHGVAIRAGHHCAQPVMDHFGLAATARASFGLYNTTAEIDALVEGLVAARELFGV